MNLRSTTKRWCPVAIGLLLVALGLACLNYTKADAFEYHQAWSQQRGAPAPSSTILWGGAGFTAIGAFVLGFSFARRKTGPGVTG